MTAAALERVDLERAASTVAYLRERIRSLEAAPRQLGAVVRTGVAAFDGLLPQGGLPLGHAVELWGEAASGRTSLALKAVAAAQRAGRLCAWVDGPAELYPPTAQALGVDLRALLMVRPRAPGQLAWAAQQLARSGAFACVVLDVTHTGARLSPPRTARSWRTPPSPRDAAAVAVTPRRRAGGRDAPRWAPRASGPRASPWRCSAAAAAGSTGGGDPLGRALGAGPPSAVRSRAAPGRPRRRRGPEGLWRSGTGSRASSAVARVPGHPRASAPGGTSQESTASGAAGPAGSRAEREPGGAGHARSSICTSRLPRAAAGHRENRSLTRSARRPLGGRPAARRVVFASTAAARSGCAPGMTRHRGRRARARAAGTSPGPEGGARRRCVSLGEALMALAPGFQLAGPDGLWLDGSAAHALRRRGGPVRSRGGGRPRARLPRAGGDGLGPVHRAGAGAARPAAPLSRWWRSRAPRAAQALPPARAARAGARTRPRRSARWGCHTLGEVAALPAGRGGGALGAGGSARPHALPGRGRRALRPGGAAGGAGGGAWRWTGRRSPCEPLLFAPQDALRPALRAPVGARAGRRCGSSVSLKLDPTGEKSLPLLLARPSAAAAGCCWTWPSTGSRT